MSYAELQVTTNFSFLRGGSHPHELVAQAKALGLTALAVTDRNTLAGVVRAHVAAKEAGLKLIIGARLDLKDGPSLLCLPTDRDAYGRLCRLLSRGQLAAEKGQCTLHLADVAAHAEGQIFIVLAPDDWDWREAAHTLSKSKASEAAADARVIPFLYGDPPRLPASRSPSSSAPVGNSERDEGKKPERQSSRPFEAALKRVREMLTPAHLYLAASHTYRGDDRARIAALAELARRCSLPLVATGDVLYHAPHRRRLQDVLTCVREDTTIHDAGFKLAANAERHLRCPAEMARLFQGYEAALARTVEIAQACRFSLIDLKYEYPDEPVPPGKTPQQHLEDLTWAGARKRFPDGVPAKTEETLRRELDLIAERKYARYFLTVHDIVTYARDQDILCQGRGSAANSVVCYCLGITGVSPTEIDLLFERFISGSRSEPPDIDVDFEHERREEVIQHIYERYGRDRAGLAATVISYRSRSAVRDIGKAMGLTEDTIAALSGMVWGSHGELREKHVRQAGLEPSDALLGRVLELADELIGFPRHLSQHVGGFVLTRRLLTETVPIGNAAMEKRTFIEWDKDDLAAVGLLKVDVLGLGMLTCIHRAFDFLKVHHNRSMTLASVPREAGEAEAVYHMLCKAESIGVFQVESRAQMSMLPRLKPQNFYDLVIEVAIVRPGPIQGDMVHPYLRRRAGMEHEDYPEPAPEHGDKDELKQILGKTRGVPLFQEQAMRIAMVAAKFSDEEANELRRAMATFRRRGTIGQLEEKMISAMVARGYEREFATRCFNQIKGFGDYGFPESHAASFAHLVYISAWLKCYYPAAFAAALLNSQPMGFYAPAQLVGDACKNGVEARPPDVSFSDWFSTLEPTLDPDSPALRLGLHQIEGLGKEEGERIVAARNVPGAPLFSDLEDLQLRAGVKRSTIETLAAADAFRSMGLDRRQALWEAKALPAGEALPLFQAQMVRETGREAEVELPQMPLSEHVVNDYQTLRLSLKAHPMSFLRERLKAKRIAACEDVRNLRDGAYVSVAGVVLVRQRPGSAKGVVFMTIEDETGIANAVVWQKTFERHRKVVMGARLILIRGRIQRQGEVIHIVAARLEDYSDWLMLLSEWAGEMAVPVAHADHVAKPLPGHVAGKGEPRGQPRWGGHPRKERIIPKSRDFH